MKNLCGKTVTKENAYEVWSNCSWTWYVLKKWQSEDKEKTNPYARWFCLVVTPMTGESGDMGDVYVREIKQQAVRIK